MLVLSREAGSSISVRSGDGYETCLLTVLKILPKTNSVSLLINRASFGAPGELESSVVELSVDSKCRIGPAVELTLGIVAPPEFPICRFEILKAINNVNKPDDDPDLGAAGSPVRRPSSPKPPSLDVRLDEPRSEDERDD